MSIFPGSGHLSCISGTPSREWPGTHCLRRLYRICKITNIYRTLRGDRHRSLCC